LSSLEIPWLKRPLPKGIEVVDKTVRDSVYDRFSRLTEVRKAPSSDCPNREVRWPKEPVSVLVFPEGIQPFNNADGIKHESTLDQFFLRYAPRGVFVWAPDYEKSGCFSAKYNKLLRSWIASEMILTPVCIMAIEATILILADDQLRYSILGASDTQIKELKTMLGGVTKLRADFESYVNGLEVGFGESDRQWAHEYLLQWCDW